MCLLDPLYFYNRMHITQSIRICQMSEGGQADIDKLTIIRSAFRYGAELKRARCSLEGLPLESFLS